MKVDKCRRLFRPGLAFIIQACAVLWRGVIQA